MVGSNVEIKPDKEDMLDRVQRVQVFLLSSYLRFYQAKVAQNSMS